MAQDKVNENQKISYTNLDFSSIYTEVINLIKQLTYRWDPSISDESDPGVVLVKLSSLIADKCNYNIDKNVLETFPLSVTQNGNARQLYDQLGYYMNWYESASVPVLISWIGETADSTISYTIPKFTTITDSESSHIYSLIGAEGVDGVIVSDTILPADGKTVTVIAMEGTPVQYQFENETVITSQMVDPISRRLYFPHSYISQNGVFIKNTNQENYASWKRVNNLYENTYNELRYIFGYDSNSNACYLEFPDNYSELFGSGIEITYLVIPQDTSNVPAQALNQFLAPLSLGGDTEIVLDSSNTKITNYTASIGHKDIESIDEAYVNYKRTVGTFKTLITLRDYLNYIRNEELDICSNAFVCDRTNDIQSTYKIMSNQHDLDTLIVKVEQVVDKTNLESTFDYKFIKSTDTQKDSNKTYYQIINDTLQEIDENSNGSPKAMGWYELSSIAPQTVDALSPFSLKFYLLRKAIALNNKTAYNQTFSMMRPYPDFDSLLGDTSHLEHIYEDLLPFGENTYIKSNDTYWNENKSYWLYVGEDNSFQLITDTTNWDQSPQQSSNVYELDVEALLPHTIMFKGVYPVVMNISTYNVLDADTQADISSNIIANLYTNVNSSQVDFGLPISVDYLVEIGKNSDDRIKNISIDPISYSLYATYYDKTEDAYIDVLIDDDMSNYDPISYRSETDLAAALIKKDIVCKSILAGTTQLLVPDKHFLYHLSQNFVDYVDNISNITGEAVIDIQNDSVTSYSLDETNSFIRKAYTLKNNEIVSLYRPEFNATKTFQNNVHFEYVLLNDIAADSSYKLRNNEYFILYNPIKDDDATSIIGYTIYACSAGAIIHTTFDIKAQTSISSLSSFVKARVIPYFMVNPSQTYYEVSTYNENYKTEIRNSSSIINNAIAGTDSISIQEIATITLDREDKYKFFWILNEPTYSSNSNLKTYTLFDTFDSETENQLSEVINSYTLRNGEALFYTNEDSSEFSMVGPGTTIVRNCGVESSVYTKIENSLYYVDIEDISVVLKDASFSFLTDAGIPSRVEPLGNGLYEVDGAPNPETVVDDSNPFANGWYTKITDEDETVHYRPTEDTVAVSGESYYKPTFSKTTDVTAIDGKHYYVLVMRKQAGCYTQTTVEDTDGSKKDVYVYDEVDTGCFEKVDLYTSSELANPAELGLYETVVYNNNRFIDTYALNDVDISTKHNRYTLTEDTSNIDRKIFSDTKYNNLQLDDISTYTNIDMSELVTSNPSLMGLLQPIYKTYYEHDEDLDIYTSVDVNYLSKPAAENLYEKVDDNYVETTDVDAVIMSVQKTTNASLFKEKDVLYNTDVSNSGYYYKPSAINTTYYYDSELVAYMDAGTVLKEYEGSYSRSPLQYLYVLYNTVSRPDTLSGTTMLSNIADRWDITVTYQKVYNNAVRPYSTTTQYYYDDVVEKDGITYKCIVSKATINTFVADEWVEVDTCWRVYTFTEGDTISDMISTGNYDDKYLKVDSRTILAKSLTLNNIYPALDGDISATNTYFYIPASFYSYFEGELVDNVNYYVFALDENDKPIFAKIDTDYKLASLFPNSSNAIYAYGVVHVYFLPKLYMFNDFVRYTYKEYYKAKELYNRNCGEIKAWTCTALDNDYIRDNPIKNIGDLWTTLQTNTSLTLIKSNIESFATGDVLIFEADESSESYVVWPTFTNTETILDLDSYKISYQRVGEDIKELDTVAVDDYKWRGYSSLMLNTSSTNGQKLEYNQSLKLYDAVEGVDPIAVLSGNSQRDITFQLKYPVENKLGTFIDVSTVDMLGENILNTLYAFTPFANGTHYAYNVNDYKTYLYFNSDESNVNDEVSYSPQEILLPIGLPAGDYLLGMNMKDNVSLTINYINTISQYDCRINVPAKDSAIASGDMLYTFDTDYQNNLLHSYVNEDRTVFSGDKYEYINLSIASDFMKVTLPSLTTFVLDETPYELGWYTLEDGMYIKVSDTAPYNSKGSGLLEVIDQTEHTGANPYELGWYEVDNAYYVLSTDTTMSLEKTYYSERELYVDISDVTSYLEFIIDDSSRPLTYTILDIFKYEPNPALGSGFDTIKNKVKQLDVDEEYNYLFIPTANDLIENPLETKSFWNTNHVYNEFIIPQLNFDDLSFRYITTKLNR